MRNCRLIFMPLLCALMVLTACTEYSNVLKSNDYEYKYEAAKALYAEGHYRQASELFSLLLAPLKGTSYGEESLYMVGESNLKAKDYESAVLFFKKYYQTYPKGQYNELARFNSGYSLYKQTPDLRLDQSSTMEAIKEFQNFLDYCPETNLKEQVHEIIFDMQDKLVQKEYMAAKLYYDLGTYTLNSIYGGNNYEACVVTAQNALKDYPYASAKLRENLSILSLKAKYHLARQSVEEKRVERFRDAVDEYYAFQNDYPESQYMNEANSILKYSEKVIERKGIMLDDDDKPLKKSNDKSIEDSQVEELQLDIQKELEKQKEKGNKGKYIIRWGNRK